MSMQAGYMVLVTTCVVRCKHAAFKKKMYISNPIQSVDLYGVYTGQCIQVGGRKQCLASLCLHC